MMESTIGYQFKSNMNAIMNLIVELIVDLRINHFHLRNTIKTIAKKKVTNNTGRIAETIVIGLEEGACATIPHRIMVKIAERLAGDTHKISKTE